MRVAVVSGSNKGIGFAIVRALCKKFDGDVFLTSRDEVEGCSTFTFFEVLDTRRKNRYCK